jgi:DNA-binding NarL/FixJ family response regulator
MGTFSKNYESHPEKMFVLDEVKRRTIVHVFVHWENDDLSDGDGVQLPDALGAGERGHESLAQKLTRRRFIELDMDCSEHSKEDVAMNSPTLLCIDDLPNPPDAVSNNEGPLEHIMINRDQVKVTCREQQVLNLLVQGCSNKDIGCQLAIPPQRVKQILRMLFVRAGIREGVKRVKLARYAHEDGGEFMTPRGHLNPKESQISLLVWEGLTNRKIGEIVGTSEQVIKNHLRKAFDKLGVWSRLELAMYVASHGGKEAYRNRMPLGHDGSICANF